MWCQIIVHLQLLKLRAVETMMPKGKLKKSETKTFLSIIFSIISELVHSEGLLE